MGSTNFFSKLASIDPLAQKLDLPGAHKYAQAQAQDAAGQTDTNGGAYTGIGATLAGANAGYAPGGPGAPAGWAPTQPGPLNSSGIYNFLQKTANLAGNVSLQPSNALPGSGRSGSGLPNWQAGTSNTYVQPTQTLNPTATQNPTNAYARAAQPQNSWGG